MTKKNNLIACHYFRLSRHMWELMLTRIRQLGAETLYTPVPWSLHEFEASKFDLRGITNPRRDVAGFVELCAAMGFDLILDLTPGPIAGANLLNHGVPGWLLRQHPEVRAQDAQGNTLSRCTLEHPTFLKLVTRWFEQISQTLGEKQTPAGPILSAQIAFDTPAGYLDHNEHISKVQWPLWLRKRYAEGGIEALNAAYTPAIPYRTVSQVALAASLDSPAFNQDRDDFSASINLHTLETYAALLQDQGWAPAEAVAPPPHSFQVTSDPSDAGVSFQWAMAAPIRADGSLRHTFRNTKEKIIETIPGSQLPPESRILGLHSAPVEPAESSTNCYRLLTGGELLDVSAEAEALNLVSFDSVGVTDFYFTLNAPDTPLTGYLENYLSSLLAGQTQTLQRCIHLAEQLAKALQPAPHPETPTTPPPLTEAQLSLEEASLALRRAAASIGALEEAFTTALNKPQPVTETPFLQSIDGRQLGPIRESCQTAAAQLKGAIPAPSDTPLTTAQYQTAYRQVVSAANEVIEQLGVQFQWLREGLAVGSLPSSARTVHHYVETILQSLARGVLRD